MELSDKSAIQFANVQDNETFTYPLIVIKGCVSGTTKSNNENIIIVSYLDVDGNVEKIVRTNVCDGKFLLLVNLRRGRNNFFFKYKSVESKVTFHYVIPSTEFVVSPVYIICEGEEPRNDVEKIKNKIFVGCSIIQMLIAETLYHCGFQRKTFALEQDANGNSGCLIFSSKLNIDMAVNMTSEELWEFFGREIMTSEHGYQHRKFLSFLSHGKSKFSQHLAIGGGGLALCSAEYIETWPNSIDEISDYFVDETLTNFIHANHINKVYGNCFSASLGAVCHELCHTFDLGHTINGIMGRDFDRVGVLFSLFKFGAFPANTRKSQNFNFIKSKKDSLVICEGSFSRELNINYWVNGDHRSQNLTRNVLHRKCDFSIESTTHRENIRIHHIFPYITFWSNGCATLLAHHKWINRCTDTENYNNININDENNAVLKYDSIRNIVTSHFGIVVVQLRNLEGYVLKSWEFSEWRRKTLFLVPICESRKANSIIVEDFKGNLLKRDIEHFLHDV